MTTKTREPEPDYWDDDFDVQEGTVELQGKSIEPLKVAAVVLVALIFAGLVAVMGFVVWSGGLEF